MSGREYEKTVLAPGAMDAMEKSAGRMVRLFCFEEEKQYICITKFCHNCHYFGINNSGL